jgi:hypothetical protein
MMPTKILELLRAGEPIIVHENEGAGFSALAIPAVRHDASDHSREVLRELIALHRQARRK